MATWSFTTWSDDIPTVDHVAYGQARILQQYIKSPRLLSFLEACLDMVQDAEDLAYQMLALRSIYTAVGVQLDTVGKILGYGRPDIFGSSDPLYRLWLIARTMANRSNGRIEELNSLLSFVGVEDIAILECFPAGMEAHGYNIEYVDAVADNLSKAKGAGIALQFIYSVEPKADTFHYSSTYGVAETSATYGYGSRYVATGGVYAGAIRT